jgi:hypothetical protein
VRDRAADAITVAQGLSEVLTNVSEMQFGISLDLRGE